jgi:hypothetical protein
VRKIQLSFGTKEDLEKGVVMVDEPAVCWIVDNSLGKTISDAARFGTIEHVFTDVNTSNIDLVKHAREVLADFREGDYLCLIGDPKLFAVCVGVIAQNHPGVLLKMLQFDARIFRYVEIALQF